MRVIKICGSGNLAGKVWYGQLLGANPFILGGVVVWLDEPYWVGPEGSGAHSLTFSGTTGGWMDSDGVETDWLHVDLVDLPRLEELLIVNGIDWHRNGSIY